MTGKKAMVLVTWVWAMALGAVAPVWAQSALGPLASAADRQLAAGWKATEQNDQLVLRNVSAPKNVPQLLTFNAGPAPAQGRVTRTSISLESTFPEVFMGLLVRSAKNNDQCLMSIHLGSYTMLSCKIGGKYTAIAPLSNAVKLNQTNEIAMTEQPGVARFFVNGVQIADLKQTSVLGGQIGILVNGRGTFSIKNFSSQNVAPNNPGSGSKNNETKTTNTDLPIVGNDPIKTAGIYIGVNNGIFMHEFGHALIGELDLPSTGPEEDAVDIYSALQLSDSNMYSYSGKNERANAAMKMAILYSVLQWYYSGKIMEIQGVTTAWQDEHTPNLKRFRNIFCIAYGANPGLFSQMAELIKFDKNTLSRCEKEFHRQNRAWLTILAPYTRINALHPEGLLSANAPGARITLKLEPSKLKIGEFLRNFNNDLTVYINGLSKLYAFPRPITVIYRDCGKINAWYDQSNATLTMCYEVIDYAVRIIANVEAASNNPGSNNKPAGGTASANQTKFIIRGSKAIDEFLDLGVPTTPVLFPAPYKGPTPKQHSKASLISTKNLVDALNKAAIEMLLIDTSESPQTIPGAIPFSAAGTDGSLTDAIQSRLDELLKKATQGHTEIPIVFFGKGLQDRSSYNAALRTGALGWKTYWYRGGIEAWQSNGLPLAPVKNQ
jgi:rhodanese-related sulfurtransferase